jgi:hypothetical protein
MTIRDSAEQARNGTRQRVVACRKRLRRERATQRALRVERDEAVLAADELLALVSGDARFADSEEIFEEAGAAHTRETRRFTPEVDRRTRLRAR